jgi:hypothetical protein
MNARSDGMWMHRHLLVVMVFVYLGFVFTHLHYSVTGLLWKPSYSVCLFGFCLHVFALLRDGSALEAKV